MNINRKEGDVATLCAERLAWFKNGVMFGLRRDNLNLIGLLPCGGNHTAQRKIVGFGSAACKEDFTRLSADCSSDTFP
jgi:hypothetical protein